MKKVFGALLFMAFACSVSGYAQQVTPTAYFTDQEGEAREETQAVTDGEAPLTVLFKANPSNMEGYTPSYEWHFAHQAVNRSGVEREKRVLMVRYEEDTEYTFTQTGTYYVTLVTHLDSQQQLDSATITITISESRLEFPNAFSPNGDGINDVFKAKDGWRSIVEFHAYIYNRWGQKLYDWTSPAGGWDGTTGGHDCPDGTYFLLVKARGADGRNYNIRKDVNLLRGYTEGMGVSY